MKRSWIGAGLLALLLASAALVTWGMDRVHEPIARELDSAAEFALSGNWDQAEALAKKADAAWQESRNFSACFADHGPMEEIDGDFAQLEVYANAREGVAFAAAAAQLSQKVQAMGDAHGLVWWNVL